MSDTRTVVGINDVWISVDIDDSSDVTIAIGTDTQETWPIEAFFAKDAPKLRELAAAITAAADHIDPPAPSGGASPTPTAEPRQQWAVQHPSVRTTAHNSPWSTLYTLSKLPGGTIVTRHSPDQPWTPTTECMCGGQRRDDGGHFVGCPVRVSGGSQP
jgi:hypothetical protein